MHQLLIDFGGIEPMRFSLAGFAVAMSLLLAGAPAAQASDASLKATVAKQQKKLGAAAERYQKATKMLDLDTSAQVSKAKAETRKLVTVTQTYHDAVKAESADSSKYKKALTKLLDAL